MARAKGRHWVALWLVAFLVTTWWVYARQTAAIRAARELGDLRGRRANPGGPRAAWGRRFRPAGIGAEPAPVGAPAAQIAELAGRADGGGLAGVDQPRGHKERHEPEGDPVTAFSSWH